MGEEKKAMDVRTVYIYIRVPLDVSLPVVRYVGGGCSAE